MPSIVVQAGLFHHDCCQRKVVLHGPPFFLCRGIEGVSDGPLHHTKLAILAKAPIPLEVVQQ